ncbi:MAG: hypothetical protein JXR34_06560 [Bacteroidales bacterium]|nr:hypothetical protein [Bacteroidales bacterium]
MKKALLVWLCVMSLGIVKTQAQVTIGNGHHVLEITGLISPYYGHRWLDDDLNAEDAMDFKKNRFKLKDAIIEFEGRIGNDYEYELQFDIADFASGRIDPEDPGLMDAYILYKGLNFIDIKFGYTKLPYSRSSLVPNKYVSVFNRAELVRGDFFSRRDVGITLQRSFWHQRINAYLGTYTGMGSRTLDGNNDASGNLEYLSRVDISYPANYKYRDIDDTHVPIPMFSFGANARFAEKRTTTGSDYFMQTIDGKKYTYGLDFSAQYMGFSTQFEIHQMRLEPNTPEKLLGYKTDYVLAGGWFGQMNYHSKKLHSIFTVRFEEFNQNDLQPGVTQIFSGAYAYMLNGFNSMIRLQFNHIVEEEILPYNDGFKWTDEFKIGWILTFK